MKGSKMSEEKDGRLLLICGVGSNWQRDLLVVRKALSGVTYKEIASQHGICAGYANERFRRFLRYAPGVNISLPIGSGERQRLAPQILPWVRYVEKRLGGLGDPLWPSSADVQ